MAAQGSRAHLASDQAPDTATRCRAHPTASPSRSRWTLSLHCTPVVLVLLQELRCHRRALPADRDGLSPYTVRRWSWSYYRSYDVTAGHSLQIEMDSLPTLYAGGPGPTTGATMSPQGTPFGKSRFSEYGLATSGSMDNASSESPSFRDSTLYHSDAGRRESMQYDAAGNGAKEMEDTSLLWNEKNI